MFLLEETMILVKTNHVLPLPWKPQSLDPLIHLRQAPMYGVHGRTYAEEA